MAQKSGGKTSAKKPTAKKSSPAKASAPAKKPAPKKTGQAPVKPEKQSFLTNEIKGIVMIACGIFLLFAFLTNSTGAVGRFLKNICYGLLGISGSISCVFLALTGIHVFRNKGEKRNLGKLFLLLGLMLSTSVLTALFFGDVAFVTGGFIDQVVNLYRDGAQGYGGGLLGGGLAKIFVALVGVPGTWILAVTAELILALMLTGISLVSVAQKVSEKIKERRTEIPQVETTKEPKSRTEYFEGYLAGEEPISSQPERKPRKKAPEPVDEPLPERFELKEDDELFQTILSPKDAQAIDQEELPFRLDNMKTGTISELPDIDKDGAVVAKKNPEDQEDEEFVPPSEAKLEDVLDPLTQKAVDAGLPLDRAVVAGRRMAAEDEPITPEAEIQEQIAEHAPQRMMEYTMPTLDLLDTPKPRKQSVKEIKAELEEKANRLLDTLRSFKVEAKIINITQGPSVTRFELQPGFGVKVSKITALTDDIALSLAAPGVRIEAPIPGKSAIGIEIPNREASPVPIREVLESEKFQNFQSKTAFALGKDIAGTCMVADIAKFPHVLIAGQTGSGKSVCINSLILSILYKAKPDEVKLIMVDPKMVELGIYNGIPHLLIPVVTDPKHAAGALNWAVVEMQNRYSLLKDNNVRNLKGYNALMEERGEPESKLPEIVIIIDEFADLMIAAKSEVEDAINRLAALARAAGMYLVIATQRPTVNVITGVIKANIPSRIAFNVTSQIDSRTILDAPGADKLLGRGDMLYKPSGAGKSQRIQGNFVSDAEIERVIEYIKSQYEASYDTEIIENIQKEQERIEAGAEELSAAEDDGVFRSGSETKDELFFQAVEMVLDNGQASVAMFQRRFKIGYQRAARLIDQMEERRIIGPYEGTKPRQVLISRQEFLEMKMNEPN